MQVCHTVQYEIGMKHAHKKQTVNIRSDKWTLFRTPEEDEIHFFSKMSSLILHSFRQYTFQIAAIIP